MAQTGSKGLSKKKVALRSLIRRTPESEQLFQILVELPDRSPSDPHASDRTAAIMGAVFLEHALKEAISHHLAPDLDDPGFKSLFDLDEAPYREFAGRNRLAKALGVINTSYYKQMETIRLIRNAFAHTLNHLTFETEEIAAFFEEFDIESDDTAIALWIDARFPKESTLSSWPTKIASRRAFVFQIFKFYLYLMNYPQSDKTIFDEVMQEASE